MWSLSTLRSLNSSSRIGINGGFRYLSHVPPRFPTGAGERNNEMERNSKPQDNTVPQTANTSTRDFFQGRLNSTVVAGEGGNTTETNSKSWKNIMEKMANMNSQDNLREKMANMNSQDNLREPMTNMNPQYNSRGPMLNMNLQDNFRQPMSNMNWQGNLRGSMANMNSQDNFRGPMGNMSSQDNFRGSTGNVGSGSILRETVNSLQHSGPRNVNNWRNSVKGALEQDPRYSMAQDAHFVLIQLKRNNTHINVTDAKGDTKFWTASGNKSVGGGGKVTRYAAEATAEYVGRRVREMGLKSVVMRVKGFTYFKKKKQAIMSFKEGYSSSRSDRNPIVYIEDVTRKPHNGCRLPKKRRI